MTTKISIFIAIVLAVSTSMISFSILNANAQTESPQQPSYWVDISKDATSGLIVTDGASYVNGFDTTYTLKGKQLDFNKARDLLVSGIADDFLKSPTSGYVKVTDASSNGTGTGNGNGTGIANPFASQEQVSEKIKSVLNGAIDTVFSGEGLTFIIGPATYVIKCTFGDSLDDFECYQQGGFKF
jgi:hypothetical protein